MLLCLRFALIEIESHFHDWIMQCLQDYFMDEDCLLLLTCFKTFLIYQTFSWSEKKENRQSIYHRQIDIDASHQKLLHGRPKGLLPPSILQADEWLTNHKL